jgi:hypothetical protein
MKLRTSPSGPFFTGLSGDSLVCAGGDEWSVVSGVGTTTQSLRTNIEFALLPPTGVPLQVPGTQVLNFGATTIAEKMRIAFSAAVVNSPGTPVSFAILFFLQVSLDGGATWKNPTAPGGGIADAGAVAIVRIAALDPMTFNVSSSIEVALGLPQVPKVRLAYISNGDCFINGAVAPGGFSEMSADVIRGGFGTSNILV